MKGDIFVTAIKVFLAGLLLGGLIGGAESLAATASQPTRTNSDGGVTVTVTPIAAKANGELRFQVVLDTHSVNLDAYDLKTIAVLRDGSSKTYGPIAVENKGGGHHRQAVLTFPRPAPETKSIELLIKDVAGVKERTFQWELK
jgi:hypothetical protein